MKQSRTFLFAGFVVVALVAALGSCELGGSSGGGGTAYSSESLDLGSAVGGSVTHNGSVDTTASYYTVTVSSSEDYDVTLSNMLDDADLYISYDGSTLGSYSINPGTTDDYVLAQPTGTVLYIMVDGSFTVAGTSFTLSVVAQ